MKEKLIKFEDEDKDWKKREQRWTAITLAGGVWG
jgi:hypothetical protein